MTGLIELGQLFKSNLLKVHALLAPHMTIQTAVLIETLTALGTIRLFILLIFFPRSRSATAMAATGIQSSLEKGSRTKRYEWSVDRNFVSTASKYDHRRWRRSYPSCPFSASRSIARVQGLCMKKPQTGISNSLQTSEKMAQLSRVHHRRGMIGDKVKD